MWSDLNASKDAVSTSEKERSRQRVNNYINELGQGTLSLTDVEFARLKQIVERRGRDAAHVTVAPVDTASLENHGVYEMVPITSVPSGRKVVGTR